MYSFKERMVGALPAIIIAILVIAVTAMVCYSTNFVWDFTYGGTYWVLGLYVFAVVSVVLSLILCDDDPELSFGITFLTALGVAVVLGILFAIFGICNGAISNDEEYFAIASSKVSISEENLFPDLIGEDGDTSRIPVIEDIEAEKKANASLAESGLSNKHHISSNSITSQEVDGRFIYTMTIAPDSWFKWDGTTKGYVIIDRNTGETTVVKDEFKYSTDAKFGSLLCHGSNNVKKLLIKELGGTWVDIDLEIDNEGKPYWVATHVKQSGPCGYTKVLETAVVDPYNGEIRRYNIGEEPDWVERVFPEEVMLEYLKYYGLYIHGWENSWKAGDDVMHITNGYNIVYFDGIPHLWTGLTASGGSNSIGIALCNLKTGEITICKNGGISESQAQSSAMGLVQEKGYKASFPIILTVNGAPSYFMLLRDDSNNVQGYAFVSHKDYNKAAFGTTVADALVAYKARLAVENTTEDLTAETTTTTGVVAAIASEVVDGRTVYYIKIEGVDTVFAMQSSLNIDVVFLELGDTVAIGHNVSTAKVVSANSITIQ